MSHLEQLVAKLAVLRNSRQSASEYFRPFLDSEDEVLAVGAWCVLIDRKEIPLDQLPRLVDFAKYGAVRTRGFDLLQGIWETSLATAVARAPLAAGESEAIDEWMAAKRSNDNLALATALRRRYLATGRPDLLIEIIRTVERGSGWAKALPYAVDAVLLMPHDPRFANSLLALLYQARAADLLDEALRHLRDNKLHEYLVALYTAALRQMQGRPEDALRTLKAVDGLRPSRADVFALTHPVAELIRAECLDKLGKYREAYASYATLNGMDHGAVISLDSFPTSVMRRGAFEFGDLPPDPRSPAYFDMLGFPRSGTTLLENALAAHPDIQTFEEVPAITATQRYLDTALTTDLAPDRKRAIFLEARERYYAELALSPRKPAARIFVDKMPIRSAEARFMTGLFPDKRYVFSIRHPFDVVLSAFKQLFAPNFAMEHFRRFDTSVKMYDFTMTQWFEVFSLDDPRVHYVRYDVLVTDFEPTLRGTLSFLGADWNDAVLDFASAAQVRATRTPSYQKVRQGLSIGVQSSWRNYGFLFESEAARPLYKWAEFFGYPTK